MFAVIRVFLAIFIVFFLGFCMPSYAEDRFTSKDFLEWEAISKKSYIQTSFMMASMIAAENNREQSKCISNWYGSDQRGVEDYTFGLMQKHSTYHPMGVIVAAIEKRCGSFKYN